MQEKHQTINAKYHKKAKVSRISVVDGHLQSVPLKADPKPLYLFN